MRGDRGDPRLAVGSPVAREPKWGLSWGPQVSLFPRTDILKIAIALTPLSQMGKLSLRNAHPLCARPWGRRRQGQGRPPCQAHLPPSSFVCRFLPPPAPAASAAMCHRAAGDRPAIKPDPPSKVTVRAERKQRRGLSAARGAPGTPALRRRPSAPGTERPTLYSLSILL